MNSVGNMGGDGLSGAGLSNMGVQSQAGPADNGGGSREGKKAVHVKWAGKTIALGTFPIAEADEKCARAKALTRAWRSTMRPKPNREWVMLELERLQVRVVSGRLGRRGSGGDDDSGSEGGDEDDDQEEKKKNKKTPEMKKSTSGEPKMNALGTRNEDVLNNTGMNAGGGGGGTNHLDLGGESGLSSLGGGNSLTGGTSSSGLLGGTGSSMNMNNLGLSVNPNQHYEMLKLHHMNLLNEIQETTLMMNLYQQQQFQQQQQLQQQQLDTSSQTDQQQLLQLAQQQQLAGGSNPLFDSLYGIGGSAGLSSSQQFPALHPQASHLKGTQNQMGLGLGSSTSGASNQMQALLRQQNLLSGGGMLQDGGLQGMGQRSSLGGLGESNNLSLEEQEEACQHRLMKLKQDIAERQRRAEIGGAGGMGNKRNSLSDVPGSKRAKVDN